MTEYSYYYLTYHDAGIGVYDAFKEAVCFDISERGAPKSEFGKLIAAYRGVEITEVLINRVEEWNHVLEATFPQQGSKVIDFLEKYQKKHVIEFCLHNKGPK